MSLSSGITSLKANKKLLRKTISASLKALPAASIQAQSQLITARVLALPLFQSSTSISCYMSMPSGGEMDTSALVLEILRAGKSLYVPKIDKSADQMIFLRIYDEADLKSIPPGVWGIPEPELLYNGAPRVNVKDSECDQLDMILMPGVAFDRSLSRLGHGKGYYDRFISTYTGLLGKKCPSLVGLSLKEQLLDFGKVPMGEHDWPVHSVVTPDAVILPHDSGSSSVP